GGEGGAGGAGGLGLGVRGGGGIGGSGGAASHLIDPREASLASGDDAVKAALPAPVRGQAGKLAADPFGEGYRQPSCRALGVRSSAEAGAEKLRIQRVLEAIEAA